MKRAAFTLVESLVVVAIVGVLAAIAVPVYMAAQAASSKAIGAHSLHTLATAGRLYLNDHDGQFWKYKQPSDGGTLWWFGWESQTSASMPEGERTLDYSRGPLGPYVSASGGVKTDPAFAAYRPQLKPKYKNGNYGYGYNKLLELQNAARFSRPGEIVMFATSAQVNTFQAPASASKPMVEEFYYVDDREVTVHFRAGSSRAMVVCVDGNLRELPWTRPRATRGCRPRTSAASHPWKTRSTWPKKMDNDLASQPVQSPVVPASVSGITPDEPATAGGSLSSLALR